MRSHRHRTPRLFLRGNLTDGSVGLDDRQAHYLRQVLRLRSGDPLVLFNGLGDERHAVIDSLTRAGSKVRITDVAETLPESPLEISLVQALAKAEAMDLIVRKATELGVRRLYPVFTDFGVVRLDDARAARRTEHWRSIARSACEQCGRHYPPDIGVPARLAEALQSVPAGTLRVILHPGAAQTLRDIALRDSHVSRLCLAIGPEGGFSEAELQQAHAAGFRTIRLGPRLLRTETAALAACTLAQARWGDLAT